MKRRVLFLGVVVMALFCASSGDAAPGGCGTSPSMVPMAFETITVSSTAIGFTVAKFAPPGGQVADMAVATLETNSIRYRGDGISPTALVGHVLAADSALTACGEQTIRTARFIRVTSDGTLSVTYYRQGN